MHRNGGAPRARRLAGAGIVAAMLLGACTSSNAVTSEEASRSGEAAGPGTEVTQDPVPATDPPATDDAPRDSTGSPATTSSPSSDGDPRTPTVPPDPVGLPSLGEVDGEILIGTLDNGLEYFIRRNDNPGRNVQMRLAVDAGSGVQGDDQGGGAHFLEHMLFNGTERFPENDLVDVLRSFGAAFGADVNASTSFDETVYELTMPTDDPEVVATGLDVLEQWLTSATIAQEQVEAERGVVLDEWRRSTQTSGGRLFAQLEPFFLAGSAYAGKLPIGTDTEISSTDREPLARFYDDWYRPDNAAVVVVGDIDPVDIERQIIERFEPVGPRAGEPERPDLDVDPVTEARALVLSDPDLAEGFGFVTLPLFRDLSAPREEIVQRQILDDLAFDIISTRLSNDALRGDAPFETAGADNSSFVRSMDAPEISFTATGVDMAASVEAVLEEYERVRRHGFSEAELQRAVESRRTTAQTDYDGRFSRQDASYADEYVRHFLTGESLPTADRWFEFVSAVLDGATAETVAHVFVDRLDRSGTHVVVAAPDAEADDLPEVDELVTLVETVSGRTDIEPRADEAAVGDALMEPPEPVAIASTEILSDGSIISFVAPEVHRFDNGVTVAVNRTPIAEGILLLEARSPGGLAVVADDDVADAKAAAVVIEQSGVAGFDPVSLDAFLSDKDVQLDATIDEFTEGFMGFAATSDAEVLFQLIHLMMTEPRVDDVALERYLDDELPLAEDPSINADYANFRALLDARYDDTRFLVPTVESLDSVSGDDALRVFTDRFGDASDWTFSITGDIDVDELTALAQQYLGTLPGTGRREVVDYVEPDPPAGLIEETVRAGDGDQALVSWLYTAPATTARRDDIAARVVNQVVQVRLTDAIREELGDSYSPFANLEVSSGPSPVVESYLQASTGPDLVDDVIDATMAQLADLRLNGPTDTEYSSAIATLDNELGLFSNQQINDEILDVLVDPAGNPSLDDFLFQQQLLTGISPDDVRDFIRQWLPVTDNISVITLPR